MKKFFNLLKVMISVLVLASCGNGSSGTQMLNLGDVRIVLDEEKDSPNKAFVACEELLMNLFTVLPGPYEFTWTELENEDGSMGYEQCRTQLKIKLKLNKMIYVNVGGNGISNQRSRNVAVLGGYNGGGSWMDTDSWADDYPADGFLDNRSIVFLTFVTSTLGITFRIDSIHLFGASCTRSNKSSN